MLFLPFLIMVSAHNTKIYQESTQKHEIGADIVFDEEKSLIGLNFISGKLGS